MKISTNKQFNVDVYFVPADSKLEFLESEMADYALNILEYKGKLNEVFSQLGPNSSNLVVVGLGNESELTRDHYVRAAYTAATVLEDNKVVEANFDVNAFGEVDERSALEGIVEGVFQAEYVFDAYKSEKINKVFTETNMKTTLDHAKDIIQSIVNVMNGVNFTRELVNTPANDLYPETLADKVIQEFDGTKVDVEVFDKMALEELGAHALLSVAQGSAKEPRMIIMRYMPLGDDKPVISLVGKGVTYDSGGYAIKNAGGMVTMMADMAGAGSVIGTMKALESNNVQQNVVAIIGATENLISGEAFKNGDIIRSLKGTTIEVINTDAEGRILLADVLYYAATQINSKYIIDTATLTGSVVGALGSNITGVLTNNQELVEEVLEASKKVGEDMWQMPLWDEFRENIKGSHADIANSLTSPAGGGTMNAAAFLEHFVEDVPWVHLDIAGTAYSQSKGKKYLPKGASGIPVKTLYTFIKNSIDK